MGMLHVVNHISQKRLAEVFEVHRNTVSNSVTRYRVGGLSSFYQKKSGRRRTVLTPKVIKQGSQLLAEGMSQRGAAKVLGINWVTFHLGCKAGVITMPSKSSDSMETLESKERSLQATERSERNTKDRHTPMGRATHDVMGRQLAARKKLEEVKPIFNQAHKAVENGGVLTALPFLLQEGLLRGVETNLKLSNGYYGVTSILNFLAFLSLARVRNPEALRYEAPGEWGIILGLDRCPEVKTLRQKIQELSENQQDIKAWQNNLFQHWVNQTPEAAATLLIDGHSKVYTGRKGNLPKHYVSREKLCLPATVGYWLNALGGCPLMCLHQALDPQMVTMIEQEIVPELRQLGKVDDPGPDLSQNQSVAPSITLVFDREGWSPQLFEKLAKVGIAVITWIKNRQSEDWPSSAFQETEVPIYGPAETLSRKEWLAEQSLQLTPRLKVREIRKLTDKGRQLSIMTTHPTLPLSKVAGSMLSRWSQENFFKYMRQEFNLDALTTQGLEEIDPDSQVVNPEASQLNKKVKRTQQRLGQLRNRLSETTMSSKVEIKYRTQLTQLETELQQMKAELKVIPTHVKAGQLSKPLQTLPSVDRMIYETVRMIAYRTEVRMMSPIILAQGKKRNARKLLQALYQAKANIIPEKRNKLLRVQVLGLGSHGLDQSLAGLFSELNASATIYPGTDLRMFYELAD